MVNPFVKLNFYKKVIMIDLTALLQYAYKRAVSFLDRV